MSGLAGWRKQLPSYVKVLYLETVQTSSVSILAWHSVRNPLPALSTHGLHPRLYPRHITEAHDGDCWPFPQVIPDQLLDCLIDPLPRVSVKGGSKQGMKWNISSDLTSPPSRLMSQWPGHTWRQTPRSGGSQAGWPSEAHCLSQLEREKMEAIWPNILLRWHFTYDSIRWYSLTERSACL